MARIVIEEPCEHGRVDPHSWGDNWVASPETPHNCPGGSRRVLDPGSYVLLERRGSLWPKPANDALYRWATTEMAVGADDFWDALAGGEQP